MEKLNRISILFCIIWLVLSKVLHAEYVSYEGHQLWRVIPKNDDSLKMLRRLHITDELDFWKDPISVNQPVDIRVPPNRITHLRKHFLSNGVSDFEVIVDNIQTLIDAERTHRKKHGNENTKVVTTLEEFDYSVYHSADEVYQWMDIAAKEFEFIEKIQVGVTYWGRKIFSLEIRKPKSGVEKPLIYVDSLIHCREWITTASLLFIFKEMLTNPMFAGMIDDVDWYFIPMINVDGYIETWTGDRLWRKTKSSGPNSLCTGVDANRNWDDHWSGEGASPNPCSNLYHGPIAASESEVRHLQNYIMAYKDEINAVVSVHSYSQLILFPYNYDYVLSANHTVLDAVGKQMSDAIYSKHSKRYVWGPGAATIYICSGVTTDWTYNKAGIDLSYTYELRDEGQYAFILPPDQIIPTGEEFLLGLEALAEYVK